MKVRALHIKSCYLISNDVTVIFKVYTSVEGHQHFFHLLIYILNIVGITNYLISVLEI